MSVAKLSVSLSDSLAGFVENYRKKRGLKSRSQVFEEASRRRPKRSRFGLFPRNASEAKRWVVLLLP
jgi:hypothetical protein